VGIERLRSGNGAGGRVVVIGDTPHDITAAHANGAFALAVATGRNPAGELLSCGADVALESLADVAAVVGIVRAGT
jgi:phosphoglycolate phosphatase-like HAD superfamily hydrolase